MIFTENDKRCTPYVLDEKGMDKINEADKSIAYLEALRDVKDAIGEGMEVWEAIKILNDRASILNEELLKQAK